MRDFWQTSKSIFVWGFVVSVFAGAIGALNTHHVLPGIGTFVVFFIVLGLAPAIYETQKAIKQREKIGTSSETPQTSAYCHPNECQTDNGLKEWYDNWRR